MPVYLLIVGTRPEAIKVAPLYLELKKSKTNEVYLLLTGQHREMVYQVLDFFSIVPDFDLKLMKNNQDHVELLSRMLIGLNNTIKKIKPNFVVVQGDTTTVLGGSLVSFFNKTKLIHLEAGLRSHNLSEPFPEELNRVLTSRMTSIHLAPTFDSAKNLKREGISDKKIFVVGNTVIDALKYGIKIINKSNLKAKFEKNFSFLSNGKKTILFTCHRRENFGEPLQKLIETLKYLAIKYEKDINICIPVHPNPNIKKLINSELKDFSNIFLFPPFNYPELIYVMSKSNFILTDSGGIQEEGPSFGKPVLVLRNVSERMEGVRAGNAKLVGTNARKIKLEVEKLLFNKLYYSAFSKVSNPYGNGNACVLIHKILKNES